MSEVKDQKYYCTDCEGDTEMLQRVGYSLGVLRKKVVCNNCGKVVYDHSYKVKCNV